MISIITQKQIGHGPIPFLNMFILVEIMDSVIVLLPASNYNSLIASVLCMMYFFGLEFSLEIFMEIEESTQLFFIFGFILCLSFQIFSIFVLGQIFKQDSEFIFIN